MCFNGFKHLDYVSMQKRVMPLRSHTLAPLTEKVSTKGVSSTNKNNKLHKIVWSSECQKFFDSMKVLVSRETLHTYPQFDQPSNIQTDSTGVVKCRRNT